MVVIAPHSLRLPPPSHSSYFDARPSVGVRKPARLCVVSGIVSSSPETVPWHGQCQQQHADCKAHTCCGVVRSGRLCRPWHSHSRDSSPCRRRVTTAGLSDTLAPTHRLIGPEALARVMGYAVLLGACFRSVPQILRLWRVQAATGVSLTSNIAELLAYSITIAYNMRQGYAFSTYGEVVACWVQDIVLVLLIGRLTGIREWRLLLGSASFVFFCYWLGSPACTMPTLTFLQASTISMIALGGRLPQIVMNIRRKGSGELSLITCLLNFMGNIARVFTTLVMTQDPLILTGNAVQGVLNSVLLWQTVVTAMKKYQSKRVATIGRMETDEERIGMSPAAIEAAEEEVEEVTVAADAGMSAMSGVGDGGDGGGYGGMGSAFLELSPLDQPNLDME